MAERQSLRSQQRSFTRARFIDAALEVFEEFNFHETTIDMITDRAGANRSTFYLHFKDKTDLVLAAHERISPSGQEMFAPINRMVDPNFKEFRQWVEYMAKTWEENHSVYAAIMQAQLTEPSISKKNYEIVCEVLSPYLSRFKGKKKKEATRRLAPTSRSSCHTSFR